MQNIIYAYIHTYIHTCILYIFVLLVWFTLTMLQMNEFSYQLKLKDCRISLCRPACWEYVFWSHVSWNKYSRFLFSFDKGENCSSLLLTMFSSQAMVKLQLKATYSHNFLKFFFNEPRIAVFKRAHNWWLVYPRDGKYIFLAAYSIYGK